MSEVMRVLHCGEQDEALKNALAADAESREQSINDRAVGILSEHFKIEFAGSGRRSPGARGSRVGAYRMPVALWNAIDEESGVRRRSGLPRATKKEIVAEVLAEHYGFGVLAA